MSGRNINLEKLRVHLASAKERLAHEKHDILTGHPLPADFNREAYAFAYVRAERMGMKAINRRLSEIEWLPMQLDAKAEIVSENRSAMKRWLASPVAAAPDAEEFGNDFMHALTRCAMLHDWDDPELQRLSSRIANLFRDLSCLIGIVYYCTWLAENRIDGVTVSEPENLMKTAEEIAILMQSPEIYRYLRAQEQNDEKRRAQKAVAARTPKKQSDRRKPALRLVRDEDLFDPFGPQTAPV